VSELSRDRFRVVSSLFENPAQTRPDPTTIQHNTTQHNTTAFIGCTLYDPFHPCRGLHCVELHYVVPYSALLRCTESRQRRTALHCTALHSIAQHSTAMITVLRKITNTSKPDVMNKSNRSKALHCLTLLCTICCPRRSARYTGPPAC
jgi:hypothetical protein